MKGDQIGIVGGIRTIVAAAGDDQQILPSDGHRGIAVRVQGSLPGRDHSQILPVHQIAGNEKPEVVSLETEPFGVQPVEPDG